MTNLSLAAFNLLPAFPLDGGRVLRAILWQRKGDIRAATRIASRTGSGLGFVLIFLGFVALFAGQMLAGLWWFLIGTFIRNVAVASYQQVLVREALQGQPVSRLMHRDAVTVPRSVSVAELIQNYIYRYHFTRFPVVDDDRLVGCVSTSEVKQVPRDEWDRQTVGSIVQKCDVNNTIQPSADAMEALARMVRTGASSLLVVDGERLDGVITLRDLLGYLAVKMELEDTAATKDRPGRSGASRTVASR
jgi:CBS domain-containing protein